MNRSEDEKHKHNIYKMNRYYRLKEQHICTQCGKRKSRENRTLCEWCARRKSLQEHSRYVLNAYENKESLSYIRV